MSLLSDPFLCMFDGMQFHQMTNNSFLTCSPKSYSFLNKCSAVDCHLPRPSRFKGIHNPHKMLISSCTFLSCLHATLHNRVSGCGLDTLSYIDSQDTNFVLTTRFRRSHDLTYPHRMLVLSERYTILSMRVLLGQK
jgi:hypothetical protein